jgi:ribosomal-protein-alanine N-acetyltransferase
MRHPRRKSRIILRSPSSADEREFIAAARASTALHRPWVTPAATPATFRAYIKRMSEPGQRAFLVCHRDTGAMAGVINLTHIVLGSFRSGYLGYYAFAGHERSGFMREGLDEVVRFAFLTMKLHRLEANIQPNNRASIALVKACGFSKEGFSPGYLKIGGRWRDHERWAIVAKPGARRAGQRKT